MQQENWDHHAFVQTIPHTNVIETGQFFLKDTVLNDLHVAVKNAINGAVYQQRFHKQHIHWQQHPNRLQSPLLLYHHLNSLGMGICFLQTPNLLLSCSKCGLV